MSTDWDRDVRFNNNRIVKIRMRACEGIPLGWLRKFTPSWWDAKITRPGTTLKSSMEIRRFGDAVSLCPFLLLCVSSFLFSLLFLRSANHWLPMRRFSLALKGSATLFPAWFSLLVLLAVSSLVRFTLCGPKFRKDQAFQINPILIWFLIWFDL